MIKFTHATMFAGKTTQLINAYEIHKRKGLNPLVIKPAIDDREGSFSGWGITKSRLINKEIPAYYFKDLKTELSKLDYGTILVDEAQFLSRDDVHYLAEVADNENTSILAYGLKTDVNGNLFEGAAAWIALADEVTEMPSLCQIKGCNDKAVAHARFVDGVRDVSGKAVEIEKGNVLYRAVCRKHWRE